MLDGFGGAKSFRKVPKSDNQRHCEHYEPEAAVLEGMSVFRTTRHVEEIKMEWRMFDTSRSIHSFLAERLVHLFLHSQECRRNRRILFVDIELTNVASEPPRFR